MSEKSTTEQARELLTRAKGQLTNSLGFNILTSPVNDIATAVEKLLEGHLALLAAHRELQEEFRTYRQRNAPALSAARMHVPIGGGLKFRSSRGKK